MSIQLGLEVGLSASLQEQIVQVFDHFSHANSKNVVHVNVLAGVHSTDY